MPTQGDHHHSPANPSSRGRHRAIKAAFIAAAAGAAVFIWWQQGRRGDWPGWTGDLDAALRQAKAERRRLIVLFTASPPGHYARQFRDKTLAKKANKKALAAAGVLTARVTLEAELDSPLARRYGIRKLPTLLLLDADGTELNRRQGADIVAEVPFRRDFLEK